MFWEKWFYCRIHRIPVKWITILNYIQGVSEIILTGNRTHQKEQLFSLPFWRKTLRNGLKTRKYFPKTVHISKTKLPKNVKQPDSYEVDFLLYG
jgi:hypothetical protein